MLSKYRSYLIPSKILTYQENLLPHQPIQEVYNSTISPVLETIWN